MKRNLLKPVLPVLILPFLATMPGLAQQITGTAHPEQLSDPIRTDHYVKPSAAAQATPAVTPAYQDSFPATATTPTAAPAAEPQLLPREASAPTPVVGTVAPPPSAQYVPYTSAPVQTATIERRTAEGNDDGIVLAVPTRPHELNQGTLLHARLREGLNTERTAEGSVFTAELTADAGHSGEVMLPAGSLIRGHVTSIHGGKRITGGAAMHLRPESISLPDGTLYRLDAQVTDLNSTQDLRVNDEGTIVLRSHPKEAAAVVGGVTATAAVTGAVIGGGIGAGVGAIVGAGVATAVYLKREVQEVIPADTDIIFALGQPLVVTPR